MIFFIFVSFLPFVGALLINLNLSWQRCLLLFPITLMLIHLSTRGRWQLVPAYIVVLGLILFGLWTVSPAVGKFVVLPRWLPASWVIAVKVMVSAGLIGAAIFLTWTFPDIDFPTPTGPYTVGTTLEATEHSDFRLWYPASPQNKAQVTLYPYLDAVQVPGLPNFLYSHLQGKKISAFINPPLAHNLTDINRGNFPVVIYDHGANTFRDDNTFRLMELASHGFIVAAIAHPKPFEDYGISAQLAQNPSLFNERLASVVVPERLQDVRLVVQQLERLNNQEGPFQNRLKLDSLGLLGYSLGGGVLSEYCLEDTRCTAIVNLDGGSFGQARQGVEAAFLQLSQSVALPSEPVENQQSAIEKNSVYYRREVSDLLRHTQSTHPTYWLRIEGTGHAAFTDLVHWTPLRIGFFGLLMGEGNAQAITRTINDLTRAFFSEHLLLDAKLETAIQQHSNLIDTLNILKADVNLGLLSLAQRD